VPKPVKSRWASSTPCGVPVRVLVISAVALAIPLTVYGLSPAWLQEGGTVLVWLPALLPAPSGPPSCGAPSWACWGLPPPWVAARNRRARQVERVGLLSAALATEMGMDAREVDLIRRTAPMHDIGKIGVAEVVRCSGTQFDPAVVAALQALSEREGSDIFRLLDPIDPLRDTTGAQEPAKGS
jgi:hypothetical protein